MLVMIFFSFQTSQGIFEKIPSQKLILAPFIPAINDRVFGANG